MMDFDDAYIVFLMLRRCSTLCSDVGKRKYVFTNPFTIIHTMIQQNNRQMLIRFAGISGIIGSILPLILIFAATMLEKTFSWNRNALSDIGVSQTAWLFNSTLILSGLLNLLFALGLSSYLDKNRQLKIGVSLIIVGNVCLALVGVLTENYIIPHILVALGFLLLTPIGIIYIGSTEKGNQFGKVSLILGIIALLALIVLPLIAYIVNLQIGIAVPEFSESLMLSIWTFLVSLKLLRPREHPKV